jgi:superfamily II helicase
MKIEMLVIPPKLKEFYIKSGITSFYPPQTEAIKKRIFENKKMLILNSSGIWKDLDGRVCNAEFNSNFPSSRTSQNSNCGKGI